MKEKKELSALFNRFKEKYFNFGRQPVKVESVNLPFEKWVPFGAIEGDRAFRISVDGADAFSILYKSPEDLPGEFYNHYHENYEFGVVLRGAAKYETPYEKVELRQGDSWRIAPNIPHVFFLEPNTLFLLVWTPDFKGGGWVGKPFVE